MNPKISNLVKALEKANEAAMQFSKTEDGGSCNFDTPVIRLPNWKQSEIDEVNQQSCVDIGDKLSGIWKGYRFVGTIKYGQGNCRTRMAEAAFHSLEADGYDVAMYYALD